MVKCLNHSKALPDELHTRVLKKLANLLGPVFALLFQQSLDTGEIPKEWLFANFYSLFKKGDGALVCIYCPVSLTCMPLSCLNIWYTQVSWLTWMNTKSWTKEDRLTPLCWTVRKLLTSPLYTHTNTHTHMALDWRPGGRGFNPRRGQQHSFMEIDHEIFSTVILSLPLIQEGQLSVSGERMCTILVNRLED